MKIEEMIAEIELEALANGTDHDTAMDAIQAVARLADSRNDDYEHLAVLAQESASMTHEEYVQVCEEQNVYIACTIIFGLTTLGLAGFVSYLW